jgi:hypothetical protein
MLQAQKQQEAMDAILAETLEQQDLRLYPERIAEAREQ